MSLDSDKMSQESLPNVFAGRMRRLLGDNYEVFERALEGVPTVSLRVNSRKAADGREMPVGDRVPWCETGRYLTERPAFTFDPLLHAGAYYVQEAASMFLERAVGRYVTKPVVALDLCAAPGGKSTHLISTLPEGRLLVDAGAAQALTVGKKSLLLPGLTGIDGDFESGAVVDVVGPERTLARGICRYAAAELREVLVARAEGVPAPDHVAPVVHRDDLAELPRTAGV